MITWALPHSGEHLGVHVQVGARGATVPGVVSRVLAGDVALTHDDLTARYAPTAAPLTVLLSARDLARVAPRDATSAVHATVYTRSGQVTYTRAVTVDDHLPDGQVFALVTPDGTYLTQEGLSGPTWTLRVLTERGAVYSAANPLSGVVFVPGQTERPAQVTVLDDDGRESPDVLAGVEVEQAAESGTTLAPWPLPPYLNPDEPLLHTVLQAVGDAADVRPEQAGRFLNVLSSSGPALTLHGALFGAARTDAPTDAELSRRIVAALSQNKASVPGLSRMLRAYGVFGGVVIDVQDGAPAQQLTFDGSWSFDGSKAWNGGISGEFTPGEVVAVFRRPPVAGLNVAVTVMRRYKAAGIRSRVLLRLQAYAEHAQSGARAVCRARVTLPQVRTPYRALTFDGSWSMDGSQTWDGLKVTPSAP